MKRQLVPVRMRLKGYARMHLQHPLHGEVGEVLSPCVSVCVMHKAKEGAEQCEGCLRTLNEIARWSAATEDERLEIRQRCTTRAKALLGVD